MEADRPKPKKPKKEPITAENHVPIWREVAHAAGDGKRIYFCICMQKNGQPGNCGATAIQQGRTSKIEVVIEPRFE